MPARQTRRSLHVHRRRQSGRQAWPGLWLMTDERQGDALWPALERLPRGAGIVFRHYGLDRPKRRALFIRIHRIARRRGLILLAADAGFVRAWQADGRYGARHGSAGVPVHNLPEIRAAERRGAKILFLSPVFPTRSHPDARPLGRIRFASLLRQTPLPVVALGGVNRARARRLRSSGFHGWAAIDAWTR